MRPPPLTAPFIHKRPQGRPAARVTEFPACLLGVRFRREHGVLTALQGIRWRRAPRGPRSSGRRRPARLRGADALTRAHAGLPLPLPAGAGLALPAQAGLPLLLPPGAGLALPAHAGLPLLLPLLPPGAGLALAYCSMWA
jgi:hypothetical protein